MAPTLQYKEYGSKDSPTLLLLHGLGGGSSTWSTVGNMLSSRYRVLAPDLLGFGHSPRPDVAYSVDDHITAIKDFVKSVHVGTLAIAGYSMGAILAVEYAARHASIVKGLSLISLPYFSSQSQAMKQMSRFARLTATEHWTARVACSVMCTLRPVLKVVAPYMTPHMPADAARDTLQHNFGSFSHSLRKVVIEHRPGRSLDALSEQPLLLVHGKDDETAPMSNVLKLKKRYPKWCIKQIHSAGHLLPFEKPEELATLLLDMPTW